jgi:UDP-glucose 4-epimerase
MRILVTGGLGVNGAWVVRELLGRGHVPISLDAREELILVADVANEFQRETGDILDVTAVKDLLQRERIDAIAHLAIFAPPESDPYRGYLVNGQGTVAMLQASTEAAVQRFVYTSSKAVYGPLNGQWGYPTYKPVTEDHPLAVHPSIPVYSAAKRYSEEAGCAFADRYGLEFIALRFSTIYGPGKQARHGPMGVLSRIVENALCGSGTDVDTGADELDDLVYVRDVASSIAQACEVGRPSDRAFNIGSGRLSSVKDFAGAVQRELADVPIRVGPGLRYMGIPDTYCLMDIARAKEQLGYIPRFSLEAGIADYASAVRRLGLPIATTAEQSRW